MNNAGKVTILDGGMGQELVARAGVQPSGLWATEMMIKYPDLVRAVHDDYFAAGAEVATVNSYAIHHDRLDDAGLGDQFETLHQKAVGLASASRNAHGSGRIAGSLGPLGWSYRPDMAPPAEEAARLYSEIIAIQEPNVDLFLIETASSVDQGKGALMACEQVDKPVWASFSVDDEDGTKLRSGEPVEDLFPMLKGFSVDAILLNCSTPEAINRAIPALAGSGYRFGVYANGFTHIAPDFRKKAAKTDRLKARADLTPEKYADFAEEWVSNGATIIGGCCEVGPAHIAEIARRLGQ